MIEHRIIDIPDITNWLKDTILPHMTPDTSSYAPGRHRVWLGQEPHLGIRGKHYPGLQMPHLTERFKTLINWQFDYCLITYSGENAVGIAPHRDASYADYEAYGLNLVGNCVFNYWNDRRAFGRALSSGVKHTDPPTDVLHLTSGSLVKFNCKNLHAAIPEPNRWAANFWKRKLNV